MGVTKDGVHYVSTVTRVRTLRVPIDPRAVDAAVNEAAAEWARTNDAPTDQASVQLEPQFGVLLVKVDLDVVRHDVRPSLHATRNVAARVADPGDTASARPRG